MTEASNLLEGHYEKGKKFLILQEKLIPRLEKREDERMNRLYQNIEASLRTIKGIDTEAIVATFNSSLFDRPIDIQSFLLPDTPGELKTIAKEHIELLVAGLQVGQESIHHQYAPPKASEILNP